MPRQWYNKGVMRVLGIETSCDETGIAVFDSGRGLLADALYSQAALHGDYGGVVPELASRDHVRRALPLVRQVLADADSAPEDLGGICYTAGPGLIGALMVGAALARGLALGWGLPALGVHHMEGHLLAPMLEDDAPHYPFVALLVSGGHTQLVRVDGLGRYRLLGESVDDAAGEAFDKAAKMLGAGYPGGPHIARLAERGATGRFEFPRPMVNRPGLDFSFSGLKTFTRTVVEAHAVEGREAEAHGAGGDEAETGGGGAEAHGAETIGGLDEQTRADIARAFQTAVVDTLVIKCRRALEQEGLQRLVVAGGVSANLELRAQLKQSLEPAGAQVFYPALRYCTDNGAMIAYAGCQRLMAGERDGPEAPVRARWPMEELAPPRAAAA